MNVDSSAPQPAPTAIARKRSQRPTVPAIRSRLAFALAVWAFAWGAAVVIAVWLAAGNEVDELLDDTLRGSAELLAGLVTSQDGATPADDAAAATAPPDAAESRGNGTRFAWQVVSAQGKLQMRSALAPREPWFTTPRAGFAHVPEWHLYGMPLGTDGRMLYAAQTRAERLEARAEVVGSAIVAAFAIGALGLVWLQARVRAETATLQRLSERLAAHEPETVGGELGPAERLELQPVHEAIDQLTRKLAGRVETERAFAGHAAHALRTPLAGIDAQLAVALRECPDALRPRLQRARDAGLRLQRVVTALLGLFRSGEEPQREQIEIDALVSRLPVEGVQVQVAPDARVHADTDLLSAALLDLLDNARRHGARAVTIDVPLGQTLRLRDDGPGVAEARRIELQTAIDAQAYDGVTGLGLTLADRVARAHGGELRLPPAQQGFTVEMALGPPAANPP